MPALSRSKIRVKSVKRNAALSRNAFADEASQQSTMLVLVKYALNQ